MLCTVTSKKAKKNLYQSVYQPFHLHRLRRRLTILDKFSKFGCEELAGRFEPIRNGDII